MFLLEAQKILVARSTILLAQWGDEGGNHVKRRSKCTALLAITAFLGPGIPALFYTSLEGWVYYPRFFPALVKARYQSAIDSHKSPQGCDIRPDRCMSPIPMTELSRMINGSLSSVNNHSSCFFQDQFNLQCSAPISRMKFYFVDGNICSSEVNVLFPTLNCSKLMKKNGQIYQCSQPSQKYGKVNCAKMKFLKEGI